MNPIILECCTGAATVQKYCTHFDTTTCQDVWIAVSICASIVLVAYIAKCAMLSWKSQEIEANKNEREFKREKDKEENVWKQKADLLDKKLQILRELCYKIDERADVKDGKEIKKQEKVLRESNSHEIIDFLAALNQALGNTTPPTGNGKG